MEKIEEIALFPLVRADNKPMIRLNAVQREGLDRVKQKLNRGLYKTTENICLCGNSDRGIIISEKDRFGLSFKFVLCKTCSLIRTDPVLDHDSLMAFYQDDFSQMYRGNIKATEEYFKMALSQGQMFLRLLSRLSMMDEIQNILEIGCATGSNLYPFYQMGKKVTGYDYDEHYLSFGKNLGMNLIKGDYKENVPENSQDLVILSHVLEHFKDPVTETVSIIGKVKTNKYLLVAVPGIFNIANTYFSPALYFQNDHIYHFHEAYLKVFFRGLGMEIIYSDENCRFVLRKPKAWNAADARFKYERSLDGKYKEVALYLKRVHLLNKFLPYSRIKISARKWLVLIFEKLGCRDYVNKIAEKIGLVK
ncbi:MAG: class I SAM-dependent methyltransferase [Candidatus Omnitrophica bacterium]|nr:class I SAM-dependent methyltransferase [Candidatus Omnitrophota bacterium]